VVDLIQVSPTQNCGKSPPSCETLKTHITMKTKLTATIVWLNEDSNRGIVSITEPFGFSTTELKAGFVGISDPNATVGDSMTISDYRVVNGSKTDQLDTIELS